jgi:D-cysteine desulfhydrase
MPDAPASRPLFALWPKLERYVGFCLLGDFPTPVEPLSRLVTVGSERWGEAYVKRDDLTSELYGGNKVRTLEPWFGLGRREGKRWIFATGAYGSNHAVATVLHGARLGFSTGALLFPQPPSMAARENLRVSATRADSAVDLPHWSALPWSMWRTRRAYEQRDGGAVVMPPGGATPRGCLGFFSAAFELGLQIQAGVLPRPDEIVIGLGSTCSTAGLLVGLRVAARLGIGVGSAELKPRPPLLVAARVTPWPVTSAFRVLGLAARTARWIAELTGEPALAFDRRELGQGLAIDGAELGRGYGLPTPRGLAAIERLEPFSTALDTTYAAKAIAAFLRRVEADPGRPRLFWSTKSGAPLPGVAESALGALPPRMRRWLAAPQR